MLGVVVVTAKLSKKFYETFGEDVTNELVNWLNAVDATHKADFGELIELNFARFDAKLEQRVAELRADIARAQASTVKWMFALWAPTALATVGTALGVVSLLLRR